MYDDKKKIHGHSDTIEFEIVNLKNNMIVGKGIEHS